MTEPLDRAIACLKALPREAQADMARLLLQWIGEEQAPEQLTTEEEASFAESLAQAERRDFASNEDVRAIWPSTACEAASHQARGRRAG